jgi:hypothetical protein
VVAHRAGGRVEQGLADTLEPFGGGLGEARANRGRVTGTVRACGCDLVCLVIRS